MSRAIWMGLAVISVVSTAAVAALKAQDFQVKTSAQDGKVSLTATPPPAHHFNLEAPMSLEISTDHSKLKPAKLKPAHAAKTDVLFVIPTTGKGDGKITLFVCDDANTFCERHQVKVQWEGKAGATQTSADTQSTSAAAAATHHGNPLAKPLKDDHGFYDNRPDEAFAKARSTGKPLLIDFYGIWCPPCNELSDQVFSKPGFKKASKSFVKLKLDADAGASEALAQRYAIAGYPTVIFASADGDEISRVVGFRPHDEFLGEMKIALTGKKLGLSALKAKADSGDHASTEKLGLIYLDRSEYELALRYLKGNPARREKELSAEIGLQNDKLSAGDLSARPRYIQALESAIKEFPNSPDSIGRRETLAGLFDDDKKTDDAKKTRQEIIAAAKHLLANLADLKGYDSSDGDLWISIAGAEDSLGDKPQAEAAWKSAVAIFSKKIEAGARRGGTLELAYCLKKLGRTDEAAKLYQTMQKVYPNEFTFWLAEAKMNFQLEHYEKARDLAQTAYDRSYGANHLDSAEVLAKTYGKLGKPALGRKIIEQTLDSLPPIPPVTNGKAALNRFSRKIESLTRLDHQLAGTSSS